MNGKLIWVYVCSDFDWVLSLKHRIISYHANKGLIFPLMFFVKLFVNSWCKVVTHDTSILRVNVWVSLLWGIVCIMSIVCKFFFGTVILFLLDRLYFWGPSLSYGLGSFIFVCIWVGTSYTPYIIISYLLIKKQ